MNRTTIDNQPTPIRTHAVYRPWRKAARPWLKAARPWLKAAMATVGILLASPAHAVDVVTSSVGGNKPTTVWGFSSVFPLGDFLGVGAKLRIAPDASPLIGASTGPVSGFIDGELRALAMLELGGFLPTGNLHPVLRPYVGVRGIALPEGPLLPTPNLTGFNHLVGLTYGGELMVDLPLQLRLSGYAGGTTFVTGGWSRTGLDGNWTSGSIDTAGTTVPVFGFNLNWTLIDWLSIYAGYEWTQLPTNLRGQPDRLGEDRAHLGTLRAGLTFPFLSI